jgi:tyrosyl-tRNA synthetase
MNFIDIIKSRGFVHQFTDEAGLRSLLETPGQRAYIGFDCTAKSLHVGSLLQIMLLRWWQKCGHTPIVLLGGGTTKIGDPSGKDESRPPLSDEQIAENMASLRTVFSQFLSFSNNESPSPDNAAMMVNNDDWIRDLNYPEFLRHYGRHFSVNRMLSMDSVKLRLEREQHLSFLEFNYMILQAYDFVELYRRNSCRVQMGGSDQWGNIVAGIELDSSIRAQKALKESDWKIGRTKIRVDEIKKSNLLSAIHKKIPGIKIFKAGTVSQEVNGEYEAEYYYIDESFGITSPLLTTSTGAKMGKTAAGAVWLNADMLSPYDYWQFWRNTDDADVIRFLKLFTEISLEQIAEYETWVGSSKINDAKIILATEATALLHGREEADRAAQTARDTFAGSGVSENLPEIFVAAADLDAGIGLAALLVQAGFAASNGEARRLIKGNGVSVNDAKVAKEDLKLHSGDMTTDGFIKLSAGKKRHIVVKLNPM